MVQDQRSLEECIANRSYWHQSSATFKSVGIKNSLLKKNSSPTQLSGCDNAKVTQWYSSFWVVSVFTAPDSTHPDLGCGAFSQFTDDLQNSLLYTWRAAMKDVDRKLLLIILPVQTFVKFNVTIFFLFNSLIFLKQRLWKYLHDVFHNIIFLI